MRKMKASKKKDSAARRVNVRFGCPVCAWHRSADVFPETP